MGWPVDSSRVCMGIVLFSCASLVYYHCAFRTYALLTLASDVLIVLLCSLAVLGMLFRHGNVPVPVDPLEWEVSQDAANQVAECIANVVGATVSVLRVAAKGEDKKLFLKVVIALYFLSALGRAASGATVAYIAVCFVLLLFCAGKLAPEGPCTTAFKKLSEGGVLN